MGEGNGPIDALVGALRADLGVTFEVKDYSEHALTSGSGASAVAYVEAEGTDGTTWWGVGMDSSILDASLAAVVSAANRARQQASDRRTPDRASRPGGGARWHAVTIVRLCVPRHRAGPVSDRGGCHMVPTRPDRPLPRPGRDATARTIAIGPARSDPRPPGRLPDDALVVNVGCGVRPPLESADPDPRTATDLRVLAPSTSRAAASAARLPLADDSVDTCSPSSCSSTCPTRRGAGRTGPGGQTRWHRAAVLGALGGAPPRPQRLLAVHRPGTRPAGAPWFADGEVHVFGGTFETLGYLAAYYMSLPLHVLRVPGRPFRQFFPVVGHGSTVGRVVDVDAPPCTPWPSTSCSSARRPVRVGPRPTSGREDRVHGDQKRFSRLKMPLVCL